MRLLKLVPLLALPLLFLGATCVTRVEQKGPVGPWTIEVTNTGPNPVTGVGVGGPIVDANGVEFSGFWGDTCPYNLMPGQKSYFIRPAISPAQLAVQPDVVMPVKAVPNVHVSESIIFADNVDLENLATYKEHNAVLAQIQNNSPETYYRIRVCALLFTPSGEVENIASNSLIPTVLNPGEVRTFPIAFTSFIDGPIQLYADAYAGPDLGIAVLDPSHFTVSASRIVRTERGRELQVVGEVQNDSDATLSSVAYQVYLESSPIVRANGRVASDGSSFWGEWGGSFGGNGYIPARQKAPVAFSLVLDRNDSARIAVAGIEGYDWGYHLSPLPVTNVATRRLSTDSLRVTATVTNSADTGMHLWYACFNLRGIEGQLVGTSCPYVGWVAPKSTVNLSADLTELAPSRSAEVIVYGEPGDYIPPPT
jgi:hypothetical protein